MKKKSKKNGIASLAIVIVLGAMSLAVFVSITSVVFNQLLISQGFAQSLNAFTYAEGGAHDALLRIVRNKNYSCVTTDCYSVDFVASGCSMGTDCAKVSVSVGVGTTLDPKIITVKGIKGTSTRTIQVSVIMDNGTAIASFQNGEITSTAWSELTN